MLIYPCYNFLSMTKEACDSTGVVPFLEYHFHTFFDPNDSEQVNHAITLRNEIISNCVAKRIIAIPLHYHYDPENPVQERKFNLLLHLQQRLCNICNNQTTTTPLV